MRINVPLTVVMLFLVCHFATKSRAHDDSINSVRGGDLQRRSDEPADQYAIRCAEHFIAVQGYTTSPPTADTNRVVPEGIEWAPSKAEWLAYRRDTLDSHAAGVCMGPDSGRYTVVF